VRKVVTVIAPFVSVLAIAPAAAAQTPTATVTVTQFGCESVTVTGAGWEQTEATVEVGVLPPESEPIRENLIAGPIQVFPDEQGNIAPTVVPFNRPPPDGDHTGVVLVDGLVRGQSPIFELTGCRTAPSPTPPTTRAPGPTLPATGSSTMTSLVIGLVLLALGLAIAWGARTSRHRLDQP
jgi:LPXTG-motif cell wall-anchored protein